MADKKIALDLEINIKKGDMTLGELNKQLQDLGDNIQEQKDILIEFEKELLDLDKIQASTSKDEVARQNELNEKREQLKEGIKDQRLAIKDLTNEQSKASGEVKSYNKELENAKKGLDKTAEAQKKASQGSSIFSRGLKAVGTAFKAMGIGAVLAALKFLYDALSQNQKVVDVFSTAVETISIVLGKVVEVFVGVVEQVGKSSKGFEGLKNVLLGMMKIAITPLQLAFYGIKLAIQQSQLAWEDSFLGSRDPKTIKDLTKGIDETKTSISEVAKSAVEAGKQVGSNLGKAINEVSQVVTASVDGISKISISGAIEQAKSNVAIRNSAQLAAAQQALLVEEYDRQAEKQRQIRDEERNSIEDRKKANDELGTILDAQEKAMLAQADLQIAAAQADVNKNKNTENQTALIEAQGNRLAVLAQIEGFRSEQKVNDLALDRERLELNKSISESESQLAYQRSKFDAERITDKLKSLQALSQLEQDWQQEEMLRLETMVEATTRGTQAEADALKALYDFRETSRQATITAETAVIAEIAALNKKEADATIALQKQKVDLAMSTLTALSNLTAAFAKGDEESQKKAFKLNKAFAIGQAIISTSVGVMNALTAGGNPAKLASGIQFAEAAVVAATGAAQIATISKTQFKGGANNITTPSLGSGGSGTTPIGFTQNINQNETPMTKVIVTETDIRRATRNIDGIYNKAVVVE